MKDTETFTKSHWNCPFQLYAGQDQDREDDVKFTDSDLYSAAQMLFLPGPCNRHA